MGGGPGRRRCREVDFGRPGLRPAATLCFGRPGRSPVAGWATSGRLGSGRPGRPHRSGDGGLRGAALLGPGGPGGCLRPREPGGEPAGDGTADPGGPGGGGPGGSGGPSSRHALGRAAPATGPGLGPGLAAGAALPGRTLVGSGSGGLAPIVVDPSPERSFWHPDRLRPQPSGGGGPVAPVEGRAGAGPGGSGLDPGRRRAAGSGRGAPSPVGRLVSKDGARRASGVRGGGHRTVPGHSPGSGRPGGTTFARASRPGGEGTVLRLPGRDGRPDRSGPDGSWRGDGGDPRTQRFRQDDPGTTSRGARSPDGRDRPGPRP